MKKCAVCMRFVLQDFPDVLMSEDAANRIDGTEESEEEEDSGGSEEERSICLSPSKSPRKISRVLKRKRTLSEDLEEASDAENSEESAEDGNPVLKDKEPTDEDFQFKEPKFRKKKFIFHPFSRNSEGSLVPDPASSAVEVSSLLSKQH